MYNLIAGYFEGDTCANQLHLNEEWLQVVLRDEIVPFHVGEGYDPLHGQEFVKAWQALPKAKVTLQRQYDTKG